MYCLCHKISTDSRFNFEERRQGGRGGVSDLQNRKSMPSSFFMILENLNFIVGLWGSSILI